MADGKILILIICSNSKRQGGEPGYDPHLGLAAGLRPDLKTNLLKSRNTVFGLIKRDSQTRHDVMLGAFPRNADLVAGPDLRGTDESGQYLRSADRYSGSFYRAMGSEAASLLVSTRNHVLILSGLYGLLLPGELIQDYSCHVDDHEQIRPAWTNPELLTDILVHYTINHSVTSVLDLTALNTYRELISWNRLAQHGPAGLQIRHAFGRQSVGDGLLTPLGELFGRWLSPTGEGELVRVAGGQMPEVETSTERIYFTDRDRPDQGAPREPSRQNQSAARKDEIVRLARCIKYMLADIGQKPNLNNLRPVIDALAGKQEVTTRQAQALYHILDRRDDVEHERSVRFLANSLDEQRRDFRLVEDWARQHGWRKYYFLECQDH
jgi:hypothetical protein